MGLDPSYSHSFHTLPHCGSLFVPHSMRSARQAHTMFVGMDGARMAVGVPSYHTMKEPPSFAPLSGVPPSCVSTPSLSPPLLRCHSKVVLLVVSGFADRWHRHPFCLSPLGSQWLEGSKGVLFWAVELSIPFGSVRNPKLLMESLFSATIEHDYSIFAISS